MRLLFTLMLSIIALLANSALLCMPMVVCCRLADGSLHFARDDCYCVNVAKGVVTSLDDNECLNAKFLTDDKIEPSEEIDPEITPELVL